MIAASALDDLLVTAEGYERLRWELETLRSEGRRAMSDRLREARADGHLEDNPALFELLEEQAQLERRIATLEAPVGRALLGAADGDIVRVACPRGELRLEVVDVTGAERRAREAARGPPVGLRIVVSQHERRR